MDKKEQIEKAAKEYTGCRYDEYERYDKEDIEGFFIKGAEWALSQPKEEPKKEVDLDELKEQWIKHCTDNKMNGVIKGWNFFLPHLQKPVESEWISVDDRLPEIEDYYRVKFTDGTEDEKPFRNRPKRNILGFMTENIVTHWMSLPKI